MENKTILVALGGNAILRPKQEATFENQMENINISCRFLAKLVKRGFKLVVTYGNGPQVGNILRQNEESAHVVPALPLDALSAESQGLIAYMMQQALLNELILLGIEKSVVSVVTRAEVSPDDPAFSQPEKPIGPFYTEEVAKQLAKEKKWTVKEDANRGWRRVVPSPEPLHIVEGESIIQLMNSGHIVITCGGGGIPVVRRSNGTYRGIEAVIDKDRSSSKLAKQIGADVFLILTETDHVYLNYGKDGQKALHNISVKELERYIAEGHFSTGSMGPKVEAACHFARAGGSSIICALDQADQALEVKSGTHIHNLELMPSQSEELKRVE